MAEIAAIVRIYNNRGDKILELPTVYEQPRYLGDRTWSFNDGDSGLERRIQVGEAHTIDVERKKK